MSIVTVDAECALEIGAAMRQSAMILSESSGKPIQTAPENTLVVEASSRTIGISDGGPEYT